MVQILQDEPSFASRFMKSNMDTATAFGKAFLGEHLAKKKEEKEAADFERQFGKRMPREAREEFYKAFGKKSGESFGEPKGDSRALQGVFDSMSSMLAGNVPGIGISPTTALGISREGVEARGMFNSMRSQIEATLLPMVNKGNLAKPRFDFIMSLIPEASDSQRSIAGKLRGLAEALSKEGMPVDTAILDEIPWTSEKLKKISGKKTQKPPLSSFFE